MGLIRIPSNTKLYKYNW